ncbi:Atp-dependent rna helicase, partial [Thalictrum thalictroides]
SDVDHSRKSSHHADVKSLTSWNNRKPSLHKPETPSHQRVLKRSQSKIELSKPCDGYSSHSSALTDEDAQESHSNNNGNERTIRAVYSQKKSAHPTGDGVENGLYEVLRQELRYAVDDIRTEIEQGMVKGNHSLLANDDCLQSNNSDLHAISVIRKNYTTKLEQSEKRKQDLLAEIVAEEQRVQELSKIVKELPPDSKNTAVPEKSLHARKNNDKNWMSKSLIEDAEKYFDDFLSNVEDTDISSFDGERSDASSTRGVKKPKDHVLHVGEREKDRFSTRSTSLPVEMDGVVLPWLQWETINDGSPLAPKNKEDFRLDPADKLYGSAQGESSTNDGNKFSTSCASSSPGGGSLSVFSKDDSDNKFVDSRSYLSQSPARRPKESYFDMDEYLHMQRSEEIVFEAWRQRHRISSGTLVLCSGSSHQL